MHKVEKKLKRLLSNKKSIRSRLLVKKYGSRELAIYALLTQAFRLKLFETEPLNFMDIVTQRTMYRSRNIRLNVSLYEHIDKNVKDIIAAYASLENSYYKVVLIGLKRDFFGSENGPVEKDFVDEPSPTNDDSLMGNIEES